MDLSCESVSYSYSRRDAAALKSVSFTIGKGVTGLLGPNGAGKSTMMSLLATLARPSQGVVSVAGRATADAAGVLEARKHLGYLPQSFELMNGASVYDNVAYSAWAHGVEPQLVSERANAALGSVDLFERRHVRARKLSGGQRQRLGIACAIAHQPRVVILDEPTVGIDPLQRLEVRRVIAALGERSTVLVSTHLVEDISRIAQTLLVLHHGELLYAGTCDDFAATAEGEAGDRSVAIEDAFTALVGAT